MRRAREREAKREERRKRRLGRKVTMNAAALGAAVLFTPAAAEAATFTVTSLADTDELEGTLREEIEDANFQAGDDTIVFQSGLSGAITFDPAASNIQIATGGLAIQGPGAGQITLDAAGEDRVFRLSDFGEPDEQVSISGLTLTGGVAEFGSDVGGALYSIAGNSNAAELTIADSVITGNNADGGGGGLYLDGGSLTITNSVISDNESGGTGGGLKVHDTDGDQPDEFIIRDSIITGNRAEDGGGVYTSGVDGGELIERSTVTDNVASNGAGAIWIDTPDNGAPVTIAETTVANNRSADYGGINMQFPNGPFTVRNSTISGNSSDEGAGGLTVLSSPGDGTARVVNSTIVGNAGAVGGGIYNPDVNEIRVSSSIVAGNTATVAGPDLGDDGSSGGFSVGFSLIGSAAGATYAEDSAGSNLFGLDPQLGPLASNGGPTQTHLPALSSPAIDRGIANGLATDQRGLARIGDLSATANATGGDGTDIGSVEVQAAACKGATVPAITGTDADDTLTGTEGADAISALAGNDTANAAGGNDCVAGEGGNDRLAGGAGKDLVTGGAGKDQERGQGGKDKLKGEAGKDTLKGGGGKDKLKGGPGKDKITTGGGKDKVNCGGGKDKVNADPKDRVAANCETVV